MAKKAKTKKEVVVETPQVVEQPKVETPVEETIKQKRKEPTNKNIDGWEIKARTYLLKGQGKPLS